MKQGSILVTGGAGFIGSHLCTALLARGDRIICVDNLSDYYSPLWKIDNISPFRYHPNFSFFATDIKDKEKLDNLFATFDIRCVVHLAARAGVRPSIEYPLRYRDTNITGTTNLLALSAEHGVENFIFASSSSVYGRNEKVPFHEDDFVDHPVSPYAATKKACELFCFTYSHLTNLNIACLRFFTVYGPKGRPDMAPYLFTEKIHRGEEITVYGPGMERDFTYIDDIIRGIIAAIDRPQKFAVVNLGNSNPVKLEYFIDVIENLVGKKAIRKHAPPPPGDVPITYADVRRARDLYDYVPSVSIEEGMRRFVEWYMKERARS